MSNALMLLVACSAVCLMLFYAVLGNPFRKKGDAMAGKLVLTRKASESITITTPDGSVIVVVVEEIDRNKVRVSVSAPLETKIFRTELLARMKPSEINETPLDH